MSEVWERNVFQAGKRCGIQHFVPLGDWFVSWSPRNENSNAEGHWAHFVNLAKFILSHPATEIVDKDAFMPQLKADPNMYNGGVQLTEDQLKELFPVSADK